MPRGVFERKVIEKPDFLTLDRLKKLLSYNPETGVFVWLTRTSNRTFVGANAGTYSPAPGWVISIDGRRYLAHRLAWFYVTGSWPSQEIDHINCDRADNRFANIREASRSFNQQNMRRARRDNTVGLLGVARNRNGFRASIKVGKKQLHIGCYPTAELAHAAYVEAKRRFHPGNTL